MLTLALLLLALQTVTIGKPGSPPVVVDCSVEPGCAITVAPPTTVPPPACTWVVTPSSVTFQAAGGVQTVTVTPSRPDCPAYTTSGSTAWLTLDPTTGGTRVTASANTGAARTDTLTIAGTAVAVSQAGITIPPPHGLLWKLDTASTATDPDGRRLYGLHSRMWSGTWNPPALPEYWRETVTAGPAGTSALRFSLLAYQGQRYIGGNVSTGPLGRTETRTIRGKIRYHMGRRSAVHTQKLIILGDAHSSNRPILTIGTHFGEPNLLRMDLQIDGGARQILSGPLGTDVWIVWSVAISGSGSYTLTVNGRLLGTQTGLNFSDAQLQVLGNLSLGYYLNDSVAATDDWWFELADVEVVR